MRTSCDVSFLEVSQILILFVGPLTPLFRTSGDVCPGFQSQGESSRLHVLAPTRNKFLRFTSGATPADLSMVAEPFHPHS